MHTVESFLSADFEYIFSLVYATYHRSKFYVNRIIIVLKINTLSAWNANKPQKLDPGILNYTKIMLLHNSLITSSQLINRNVSNTLSLTPSLCRTFLSNISSLPVFQQIFNLNRNYTGNDLCRLMRSSRGTINQNVFFFGSRH